MVFKGNEKVKRATVIFLSERIIKLRERKRNA